MIVGNTLEFANSWKVYSTCPDVDVNVDPCDAEQKRYHWSKMMCSIITGETFSQCHNKVCGALQNNGFVLKNVDMNKTDLFFNR